MTEIENPKQKTIALNRFETGDPPKGGESKQSADKFVIYLSFGAWNLSFYAQKSKAESSITYLVQGARVSIKK
ncbi:MAG: hypothetical protein JRG79_17730 [Deltaproteobacteria bacterium]|nr:hypothetical protein [Deltaproteobacteria bacterium]